jgi:hypothetical protein
VIGPIAERQLRDGYRENRTLRPGIDEADFAPTSPFQGLAADSERGHAKWCRLLPREAASIVDDEYLSAVTCAPAVAALVKRQSRTAYERGVVLIVPAIVALARPPLRQLSTTDNRVQCNQPLKRMHHKLTAL